MGWPLHINSHRRFDQEAELINGESRIRRSRNRWRRFGNEFDGLKRWASQVEYNCDQLPPKNKVLSTSTGDKIKRQGIPEEVRKQKVRQHCQTVQRAEARDQCRDHSLAGSSSDHLPGSRVTDQPERLEKALLPPRPELELETVSWEPLPLPYKKHSYLRKI